MLNALTVSIHAPVKGRRDGRYVGKNVVSFNPRPREGATGTLAPGRGVVAGFNPRPREGATCRQRWRQGLEQFQSTPP